MKKTVILIVLALSFNLLYSKDASSKFIDILLIDKIIDNNAESVDFLLEKGANPNYTRNGKPALFYAVQTRNIDIISNLIDHDVNVCVKYRNENILTHMYNTYVSYDFSDQHNIREEEDIIYELIKNKYEFKKCKENEAIKQTENNLKNTIKTKTFAFTPYETGVGDPEINEKINKRNEKLNEVYSKPKTESWITRQNEILSKEY